MPGLSGIESAAPTPPAVLTRASSDHHGDRPGRERTHSGGAQPGRQRLHLQAGRLSGGAGPHPGADSTASAPRTPCARAKSVMRWPPAARTTAFGTGTCETRRVYFSPRWKAMLGYDEAEIGDDPQEWMSRVHKEDRPRCRPQLAAHWEAHCQPGMRHRTSPAAQRRLLPVDAQPRRGGARRRRESHPHGGIADRHHQQQGVRSADRAAQPDALPREAGGLPGARGAGTRTTRSRCFSWISTGSR